MGKYYSKDRGAEKKAAGKSRRGNDAYAAQIKLLYAPSPAQAQIHRCKKRFRIVVAGRRFGKTYSGMADIIAFCQVPKTRYWVIAPTYPMAKEAWRVGEVIIPQEFWKHIKVNKQDRRWVFPNGAEIEFKSADNPAALRGAGLNGILWDEAAQITDEAYKTAYPATSDRQGFHLCISSPFGRRGWFHELFVQGKSKDTPTVETFQFTSRDNPYFPKEEWDYAKQNYPEDWFEQEYGAKFLAQAATVFRYTNEAVRDWLTGGLPPNPGQLYFMGVDLGKMHDYTSVHVMNDIGEVVFSKKWRRVSWGETINAICSISEDYFRPFTALDSTGLGEPIYEQLWNRNVFLHNYPDGYKFTNKSKMALVTNLQNDFDKGAIKIPRDDDLLEELRNYEYEMTATGLVKYSAPSGKHDDMVTSLMLADFARNHMIGRGDVIYVSERDATPPETDIEPERGTTEPRNRESESFSFSGISAETAKKVNRKRIMRRKGAWN